MGEIVRAYHFVGETLRDGKPVPEDGVWLKHKGRVMIGSRGLHASRKLADAYSAAPWNWKFLCFVECKTVVDTRSIDSCFVCRQRRIVKRVTRRCFYRATAAARRQFDNETNEAWKKYRLTRDPAFVKLLDAAHADNRDEEERLFDVAVLIYRRSTRAARLELDRVCDKALADYEKALQKHFPWP